MRIAVLQPKYLDAVWYYRLLPWAFLARQTGAQFSALSVEAPFAFEAVIGSYDVLIISRPHTKGHFFAMEKAKEYGVKIIADYDDLIWEVPADNPSARSNEDENFQYNSIIMLSMADVVTVSTLELQTQIMDRFRKDSTVIRNALNEWITPPDLSGPRTPENEIRIAWRGSNTHKADLMGARQAFRDYEYVRFKFFGYRPDELLKQYGGNLSTLEHAHWMPSVKASFDAIRDWQPHYLICPLGNSTFNRCKSNIAWIEATAIGAVCIAPAYMKEFRVVPSIQYDTIAQLKDQLYHVSCGMYGIDILEAARKELLTNYLLSVVNDKRVEILNIMIMGQEVEEAREGGRSL